MTMKTAAQQQDVATKPWWKHGMVWLVLGLPLSVVIACVVTWFVIMRSPNEVVYSLQGNEDKALSQSGREYTPTDSARKHAQTGGVPLKAASQ